MPPKVPSFKLWMSVITVATYVVYIPIMVGVAQGLGYDEDESIRAGLIWPLWIALEVGQFIGDLIRTW